ncbi:hypothetical protein FOIG_02824 [Fusarium odoratissimum NRRL 54006]|uniref:Uncharacterized protein n=2 Tax=Fusarium oxysporum species complex TaxID=171631 RepID=X0K307_FUSO5|nr:uncharacterized protein FOIG_02824 [Fusarium odoratissimum NRRL 54006]EXM07919.1 hypothetical protein FOIG_02824 [Fusarium odoratissimum NRRL 54006]TXC09819.1 hypothetical protein FocTR4_00004915 [Fusarium oxysporum f. sp. cubense]
MEPSQWTHFASSRGAGDPAVRRSYLRRLLDDTKMPRLNAILKNESSAETLRYFAKRNKRKPQRLQH